MKTCIILFFCLSSVFHDTIAQGESVIAGKKLKEFRISNTIKVPAILMGIGLMAKADAEIVGWKNVYQVRNSQFFNFHTNVDDYLQYAPIVQVATLNALGIKGQNNFGNQMWLLAKSELLMSAIVVSLKKINDMPRPDTAAPNSFPSGHTAQAFVAATFMHLEYGKQNPIYSIMAYGAATAVGVLRVMNNRHWSTDVLFGAGIGVLSTNLVYLLHHKKKNRKSKMMVVPTYSDSNIGFKGVITLK